MSQLGTFPNVSRVMVDSSWKSVNIGTIPDTTVKRATPRPMAITRWCGFTRLTGPKLSGGLARSGILLFIRR